LPRARQRRLRRGSGARQRRLRRESAANDREMKMFAGGRMPVGLIFDR